MAENSKIEWTHHTFNPWRGCTKVSEGCRNCYAETMSLRNPSTLGVWGPQGNRVVAAESYWRQAIKWDRDAKEAGERRRVFCASLADVFEDWDGNMVDSSGKPLFVGDGRKEWWSNREDDVPALIMEYVRERLFALISKTPNLDWLLLTKRPENIATMMPAAGFPDAGIPGTLGRRIVPDNVWLGVSVENRRDGLPRIDVLRTIPAKIRFLSIEPLLEDLGPINLNGIDWAIVGGESGHNARPMAIEWARSVRDQCEAAGVAFFFKQWGEFGNGLLRIGKKSAGRLLDGREWNEFPVDQVA